MISTQDLLELLVRSCHDLVRSFDNGADLWHNGYNMALVQQARMEAKKALSELEESGFLVMNGRGKIISYPGPAISVTCDKVAHSCPKQRVKATLVLPGGRVYVSENHIQDIPVSGCPRKDLPHGEGYHFCKEICHQAGHAEENVLQMAKGREMTGGVIYLEGHTRLCSNCARLCSDAGVTVVREDGTVLLSPISFQ